MRCNFSRHVKTFAIFFRHLSFLILYNCAKFDTLFKFCSRLAHWFFMHLISWRYPSYLFKTARQLYQSFLFSIRKIYKKLLIKLISFIEYNLKNFAIKLLNLKFHAVKADSHPNQNHPLDFKLQQATKKIFEKKNTFSVLLGNIRNGNISLSRIRGKKNLHFTHILTLKSMKSVKENICIKFPSFRKK